MRVASADELNTWDRFGELMRALRRRRRDLKPDEARHPSQNARKTAELHGSSMTSRRAGLLQLWGFRGGPWPSAFDVCRGIPAWRFRESWGRDHQCPQVSKDNALSAAHLITSLQRFSDHASDPDT